MKFTSKASSTGPVVLVTLRLFRLVSQEDKDSDSSKEPLDDLFPNDDDDPGQGSKWGVAGRRPQADGRRRVPLGS